ncbi:hypothetical protein CBR_g6510 [Chara braunii]|uniref:Myb-like domain-containing protein n=1 Tax=Chara braunii TaxID=69332 RepID=A0A388KJZ9_CHABU|nr:hypothetical protein CBR_g6510 [Chara braunii]|eukprot:GBG70382.1 hypothetical protein CBR_g6510 [Chara braunii]
MAFWRNAAASGTGVQRCEDVGVEGCEDARNSHVPDRSLVLGLGTGRMRGEVNCESPVPRGTVQLLPPHLHPVRDEGAGVYARDYVIDEGRHFHGGGHGATQGHRAWGNQSLETVLDEAQEYGMPRIHQAVQPPRHMDPSHHMEAAHGAQPPRHMEPSHHMEAAHGVQPPGHMEPLHHMEAAHGVQPPRHMEASHGVQPPRHMEPTHHVGVASAPMNLQAPINLNTPVNLHDGNVHPQTLVHPHVGFSDFSTVSTGNGTVHDVDVIHRQVMAGLVGGTHGFAHRAWGGMPTVGPAHHTSPAACGNSPLNGSPNQQSQGSSTVTAFTNSPPAVCMPSRGQASCTQQLMADHSAAGAAGSSPVPDSEAAAVVGGKRKGVGGRGRVKRAAASKAADTLSMLMASSDNEAVEATAPRAAANMPGGEVTAPGAAANSERGDAAVKGGGIEAAKGGGDTAAKGGGDKAVKVGGKWTEDESVTLVHVKSEFDMEMVRNSVGIAQKSKPDKEKWEVVSKRLGDRGVHKSGAEAKRKWEQINYYHDDPSANPKNLLDNGVPVGPQSAGSASGNASGSGHAEAGYPDSMAENARLGAGRRRKSAREGAMGEVRVMVGGHGETMSAAVRDAAKLQSDDRAKANAEFSQLVATLTSTLDKNNDKLCSTLDGLRTSFRDGP